MYTDFYIKLECIVEENEMGLSLGEKVFYVPGGITEELEDAYLFNNINNAKYCARQIWKIGDFRPSIHEIKSYVGPEVYIDLDK